MPRVARTPRVRAESGALCKRIIDDVVPRLSREELADLVFRLDSDPDFLDRFIDAVDMHGRVRVPEMYEGLERPEPEDAADDEEEG